MLERNKKDSQIALKKACTLLDRVQVMVDDDEYCIKVVQQILAVQGLLKSASDKILENHLKTCFKNAMKSKNKKLQDQMIGEIRNIFRLSQK